MTVLEVGANALVALLVVGVIGVGDGEFLQHPELGLDQVEPGCLRRSSNGMDSQLLE